MRRYLLILMLLPGLSWAAPAPSCSETDSTSGTGSAGDQDACLNAAIPDVSATEGAALTVTSTGATPYLAPYLVGCTDASQWSLASGPAGVTVGNYGLLQGNTTAAGSGTATATCNPANGTEGDATFAWTVNPSGSFSYTQLGYVSGSYGSGGDTCSVTENTLSTTLTSTNPNEGSIYACMNDARGTATNPTPRFITFAIDAVTCPSTGTINTNTGNLTIDMTSSPSGRVNMNKPGPYSNGASINPSCLSFVNGGGNNASNVYVRGGRITGVWPANTATHFNGSGGINIDGSNGGGPIDNLVIEDIKIGYIQDDPLTVFGAATNITVIDPYIYESHRGPAVTYSDETLARNNIAFINTFSAYNDERNWNIRANSSSVDIWNPVVHAFGPTVTHGIGSLEGTAGFNFRGRGSPVVCPAAVNVRGGHYTSSPNSVPNLVGALNMLDSCPNTQLFFSARLPTEETEVGGAGSAFTTTAVGYSVKTPIAVVNDAGGSSADDTAREAAIRAEALAQIATDSGVSGALQFIPPVPQSPCEAAVTGGATCGDGTLHCPTSLAAAQALVGAGNTANAGDTVCFRNAANGGPAGSAYITGGGNGPAFLIDTGADNIKFGVYPGDEPVYLFGRDPVTAEAEYNTETNADSNHVGFQVRADGFEIQGFEEIAWFGEAIACFGGDDGKLIDNGLGPAYRRGIQVGIGDCDDHGPTSTHNFYGAFNRGKHIVTFSLFDIEPGPVTGQQRLDDGVLEYNIAYGMGYKPDDTLYSSPGNADGLGGNLKECEDVSPGTNLCDNWVLRHNLSAKTPDGSYDQTAANWKILGGASFEIGVPSGNNVGIKQLRTSNGTKTIRHHLLHGGTNNRLGHTLELKGRDTWDVQVTGNLFLNGGNAIFGSPPAGIIRDNFLSGTATAIPIITNPGSATVANNTITQTDHSQLENCGPTYGPDFLSYMDNGALSSREKFVNLYVEIGQNCQPAVGSPFIDGAQVTTDHCATADDDPTTPHDPTDATCLHWLGTSPDIGFERGLY